MYENMTLKLKSSHNSNSINLSMHCSLKINNIAYLIFYVMLINHQKHCVYFYQTICFTWDEYFSINQKRMLTSIKS